MEKDISHLGLVEDEALALDAAALNLARLDHPDRDLRPCIELINELTCRLDSLAGAASTAEDRSNVLSWVIGSEFRFFGDRETYDDPDNADLIRVIDRRRGLPVSLAILYVAAARRMRWPADALNLPGHVLVRLGPETNPVLIDPFNGGAIVGPEELRSLLSHIIGQHGAPLAEHLTAMPNRDILIRLLANQASRAQAAGKTARALTLFQRMTAIAPAAVNLWWERSRLELRQGDNAAARSSLISMLEMTRNRSIRTQVRAALDAITASGRDR